MVTTDSEVKRPNLIYVPIEPLTERYTESWYKNFPPLFCEAGFNVKVIDGVPLLNNEIKVGTFLDINSTCAYKWSQLQRLSLMFYNGELNNNDVIFFGDLEFWGLEGVRLLAQMNKVDVKIAAFLHAASYTREDAFEIAAPYQKYTEVGWIAACDHVYVGSQYHLEAVYDRRLAPLGAERLIDRLHVTKNPLFAGDYPRAAVKGVKKEKRIALTNRLDVEKRPHKTLQLFRKLKAAYPEWSFVVTSGRSALRGTDAKAIELAREMEEQGELEIKVNLTKDQYHEELQRSAFMVTHSIEENYGYCIAEAMLHGCVPIMRRGLSHNEFINDERCFFDNLEHSVTVTSRLMQAFDAYPDGSTLPDVSGLDVNGANRIVNNLRRLAGT